MTLDDHTHAPELVVKDQTRASRAPDQETAITITTAVYTPVTMKYALRIVTDGFDPRIHEFREKARTPSDLEELAEDLASQGLTEAAETLDPWGGPTLHELADEMGGGDLLCSIEIPGDRLSDYAPRDAAHFRTRYQWVYFFPPHVLNDYRNSIRFWTHFPEREILVQRPQHGVVIRLCPKKTRRNSFPYPLAALCLCGDQWHTVPTPSPRPASQTSFEEWAAVHMPGRSPKSKVAVHHSTPTDTQ